MISLQWFTALSWGKHEYKLRLWSNPELLKAHRIAPCHIECFQKNNIQHLTKMNLNVVFLAYTIAIFYIQGPRTWFPVTEGCGCHVGFDT